MENVTPKSDIEKLEDKLLEIEARLVWVTDEEIRGRLDHALELCRYILHRERTVQRTK